METRALLAFLISVAILFGYQMFFAPPPQPVVPAAVEGTGASVPGAGPASPATVAAAPSPEPAAQPVPDEKTIAIDTDLYRAVFSSVGGRLKHFELKKHRLSTERDSPPLDMVVSDSLLPLGLYWMEQSGRTDSDAAISYDIRADAAAVDAGQSATIVMTGRARGGAAVTKTITVHGDSYVLDVDAKIEGVAGPLGLSWARSIPAETSSQVAGIEGPAAYVDATLHSNAIKTITQPLVVQGLTDWAGYADHYFLAAYYPEQPRSLRFVGAASAAAGEVILWDDQANGAVAYHLFVGPKKIKLLGALGHNLHEAIGLGRFAFIARPLLELLILLHRVTGNYGWSIVLLTVGIRLIFYPVNKRQLQAMKAMQRVQPELKRIQEKYKDDRERLNKEMIEVYRRHKVNPLSGCLPMLVQLPVFLGLYNALMQAIELRHAPFMGWIHDLSQPDRLGAWPVPFVQPPGIPVLTLLMGASMVIQQRMTPSTADPVQQRMMMFLPVVFTVMFINFPAGLVLYWLSNNVLSIAQQQLMARAKS